MLRALMLAGANVFRLNFSHGSHADHGAVIAATRKLEKELRVHIGILQDLPGPKVRTGTFKDGVAAVRLQSGDAFTLVNQDLPGTQERVSVSYADLPRDVDVGKRLYLADGAIALRIVDKTTTEIQTRVEVGGELRATQGINYPDGTLGISAVTDSDLQHLEFGMEAGVDWVGVSFVKSAGDLLRVKNFLAERHSTIPVMAKIEKHEALENIDEIVAVSDGIMVARGDLGIEIPLEEVPMAQKDLIARCNRASKPVVTATPMLESMITNPRPTPA